MGHVTAPPVPPIRLPHYQTDAHSPEEGLFHQQQQYHQHQHQRQHQQPEQITSQHQPQHITPQPQMFQERMSQQRMLQSHMCLEQALPVQARHKRTQGGDQVLDPTELKTTSPVNTLQPAWSKTRQYPVESLEEQRHCETGMDIQYLQTLCNQGLSAQVPRNEQGNLSSMGSTSHDIGVCSPCLFWFKNKCAKGLLCNYCHFSHEGQRNMRIRPSKKTRTRK